MLLIFNYVCPNVLIFHDEKVSVFKVNKRAIFYLVSKDRKKDSVPALRIPAQVRQILFQSLPTMYVQNFFQGAMLQENAKRNPHVVNPSSTTQIPTQTVQPNSDVSQKTLVLKSKKLAKFDGFTRPS